MLLKVIALSLALLQPTEYTVEGNDGTYHHAVAADTTKLIFVNENVVNHQPIKIGDKVVGYFLTDDRFWVVKK